MPIDRQRPPIDVHLPCVIMEKASPSNSWTATPIRTHRDLLSAFPSLFNPLWPLFRYILVYQQTSPFEWKRPNIVRISLIGQGSTLFPAVRWCLFDCLCMDSSSLTLWCILKGTLPILFFKCCTSSWTCRSRVRCVWHAHSSAATYDPDQIFFYMKKRDGRPGLRQWKWNIFIR